MLVFLLWRLWDTLRGLSSGSEALLWTYFHSLKGQRSHLNKLRILPTRPQIVTPISLFFGFPLSCYLSYPSYNLDRLATCDFFLIFYPTRLSSPEQSFKILQEVGQKIQSYPFNYRGATILSGQEEGAYGWVTVNYLLENFIKVPCLRLDISIISGNRSSKIVKCTKMYSKLFL